VKATRPNFESKFSAEKFWLTNASGLGYVARRHDDNVVRPVDKYRAELMDVPSLGADVP
jgi:hypothetical protein